MIGRNTSSYEGPKILIKGEKKPKKPSDYFKTRVKL